jgi:hypothetical protein
MDPALREQLDRLGVTRGIAQLKPQPPRWRPRPIEELVPGEVVSTPEGAFFLRRQVFEPGYVHGTWPLSNLLAHSPAAGAALARDPRLGTLEPTSLAFLDVETTGLAGGTGTYCFLIGIGCFEGGRFVLYQIFMRTFHEERAQVAAAGRLLDRLAGVVSFNGKSFDMPLLETRFRMTRQPPRLVDGPHLDLLAPSRRIWKHRLESCALASLEREVLGVGRAEDDLPGYLIPEIWLDYVRSGDAEQVARVFRHNAEDILSLVSLANHLYTLLDGRGSLPGEDQYGLAGLLVDLGQIDRAEALYAQAARSCRLPSVREQAMRDLAYLLKRAERRAEALPWWQELASADAVYACEELAKHYEWRDSDLGLAIEWTRRGITIAERDRDQLRRREALDALRHRLARLSAKMER